MRPEEMRSAWERYATGWTGIDPAERERVLRETFSPAGVYADPVVRCQGRAELAAVMERFQQTIPGGRVVVEACSGHNEFALVRWRIIDAGGAAKLSGADAVTFAPDGSMTQVLGFFG